MYGPTEGPSKMDEEEKMLVGQIQEIKKEKDFLTSNLPSLRRTNSDDDLLSTDDGSLDDVDTSMLLFFLNFQFIYTLTIIHLIPIMVIICILMILHNRQIQILQIIVIKHQRKLGCKAWGDLVPQNFG